MLVKRGYSLDPRRRVMDLVEDVPEPIKMPNAVPPIEEEGADEPSDEALDNRHLQRRKLKQRGA
jgi:hypothetical protein